MIGTPDGAAVLADAQRGVDDFFEVEFLGDAESRTDRAHARRVIERKILWLQRTVRKARFLGVGMLGKERFFLAIGVVDAEKPISQIERLGGGFRDPGAIFLGYADAVDDEIDGMGGCRIESFDLGEIRELAVDAHFGESLSHQLCEIFFEFGFFFLGKGA